MSAIPPLSGDKQTSGERVEIDAQTWSTSLKMSALGAQADIP
jgi:hypothetical protein